MELMLFLWDRPESGALAEVVVDGFDYDPRMYMWYERRQCWWDSNPGFFLVTTCEGGGSLGFVKKTPRTT